MVVVRHDPLDGLADVADVRDVRRMRPDRAARTGQHVRPTGRRLRRV